MADLTIGQQAVLIAKTLSPEEVKSLYLLRKGRLRGTLYDHAYHTFEAKGLVRVANTKLHLTLVAKAIALQYYRDTVGRRVLRSKSLG